MKQLLSIILLTIVLNFNGQITHSFGSENIPAKDLKLNEVLGGNENYFYSHKISTEGKGVTHFIEKIDRKTSKPVDLKELNLNEEGFKLELNRVIIADDELIVFVTKNVKKSRNIIFTAITYDLNTLTKIKETELTSFEMEASFTPAVNVKLNSKNTKALVKICGATINPKGIYTEFIVYDISKSSKLWAKKLNEEYKNGVPLIRKIGKITNGVIDDKNEFEIDEEDNVHYVYNAVHENAAGRYGLNYTFIDAKSQTENNIHLSHVFLATSMGFRIIVLQNKTAVIAGIFEEVNKEKKSDELMEGIFNFIIDYKKAQIITTKFTYNKEFNPEGETANNPKKIKKAYNIDEILSYGSSTILIGHKSRNIRVEHYDNQHQSHSTFDYTEMFYYDFFIIKINQKGEIEFFRNLPYYSKFSTNSYLALSDVAKIVKQFIKCIHNDNLYVFHNEHPETTKIINSGDKETHLAQVWDSGKHFVCNKINLKDGTLNRTIIEMPIDNKFMTVLEKNYDIAHPIESDIFNKYGNTIYIPVGWGKKMERFLTITLE